MLFLSDFFSFFVGKTVQEIREGKLGRFRVCERWSFLGNKAIGPNPMGVKAGEKGNILNGNAHHTNTNMESIGRYRPELSYDHEQGFVHIDEVTTEHDGFVDPHVFPQPFFHSCNSVHPLNVPFIRPMPEPIRYILGVCSLVGDYEIKWQGLFGNKIEGVELFWKITMEGRP